MTELSDEVRLAAIQLARDLTPEETHTPTQRKAAYEALVGFAALAKGEQPAPSSGDLLDLTQVRWMSAEAAGLTSAERWAEKDKFVKDVLADPEAFLKAAQFFATERKDVSQRDRRRIGVEVVKLLDALIHTHKLTEHVEAAEKVKFDYGVHVFEISFRQEEKP